MARGHKPTCKLRMGKKPLFRPKGCTTKNGVSVRGRFIEAKGAAKPERRKTAKPRKHKHPRKKHKKHKKKKAASPSVI